MTWAPDGAANQEAAVAATDVHHDRCLAAKDGRPVKGAFVGQALEGGLSPTGPVENFAGDGDAKLALLVPDLFHESYLRAFGKKGDWTFPNALSGSPCIIGERDRSSLCDFHSPPNFGSSGMARPVIMKWIPKPHGSCLFF